MEQVRHIKYVVKVISITKAAQKIHFTVRHPENATCLSGIAITGTCYLRRLINRDMITKTVNDITGFLSLAIPNKGDVFYSDHIKIETDNFLDKKEQLIGSAFLAKKFEFAGKRAEYFDTDIPITDALMEGYYEDVSAANNTTIVFNSTPRLDINPVLATFQQVHNNPEANYKVRLYLRYVMHEKEATQTPEPCK